MRNHEQMKILFWTDLRRKGERENNKSTDDWKPMVRKYPAGNTPTRPTPTYSFWRWGIFRGEKKHRARTLIVAEGVVTCV